MYKLSGTPLRCSLQSYYRGTDTLYSHKQALENHLRGREKELFDLEESIVLYDLTNTYFEGQCCDNPKAAFGKSKEKRDDCKLATLALVVDGDGFAKHSETYPGNQYEAHTFARTIESLEKQTTGADGATVLIEAGFATAENLAWLEGRARKYIVVYRGGLTEGVDLEGMKTIKERPRGGAKIEVKRHEEEGTVYLMVKSAGKQAKERSMFGRVEQLFLDRLAYYKKGLG